MRNSLLAFVVAGALLGIAAYPTAATVVTAGLSGQCYDTAGNGGQDEARVTHDTEAPPGTLPSVKVLSVTGTVAALLQFVLGTIASGGQVGEACSNNDTLDYLEVDVLVDGVGAQVCYQGSTDPTKIVYLPQAPVPGAPEHPFQPAPGCPLTPAGPGGPG